MRSSIFGQKTVRVPPTEKPKGNNRRIHGFSLKRSSVNTPVVALGFLGGESLGVVQGSVALIGFGPLLLHLLSQVRQLRGGFAWSLTMIL